MLYFKKKYFYFYFINIKYKLLTYKILLIPVHLPRLFQVVDLQTHVYIGFLYAESKPLHMMQTVSLIQVEQLLLHAKF